MKSLSLEELVERFGCVVQENSAARRSQPLTGVSTLSAAASKHISFFNNPRYLSEALASEAGVILCSANDAQQLLSESQSKGQTLCSVVLICRNPYATFARVSQHFFEPARPQHGHSPQAYIDATAVVHETAIVSPFVYVGPGARVGARSVLYPGSFIGAAAVLGEDCLIYPNAVVREACVLGDRCILNPGAVIGGDGFGFAPDGHENVKIPQVGAVVLHNDVEIGSNASVDRGALSNTIVNEQTKIDSLVQIGHNVVIGKACFVAAGSGIAGSSQIGNRVTLAGQVGVAGHLKIGDQITVLAQAGVTRNLDEPGVYAGFPARPNKEMLAFEASLSRMVKEYKEAKAARRAATQSENQS